MAKLSQTLADALQEQMNAEMAAFLVYRQVRNNLHNFWRGAHKYFHAASEDEEKHANKIAHYLLDRGVMPVYTAIPVTNVPAGVEMLPSFELALALERAYTEKINTLYFLAEEEEDPATCVFLHKFVSDQVASEKDLNEIIGMLRRAGGDDAALLIVDKKLRCW